MVGLGPVTCMSVRHCTSWHCTSRHRCFTGNFVTWQQVGNCTGNFFFGQLARKILGTGGSLVILLWWCLHRRCSTENFPSMGIYILSFYHIFAFLLFLTWSMIKVNGSKNISEPAAVGEHCHNAAATAAAPPKFFLPWVFTFHHFIIFFCFPLSDLIFDKGQLKQKYFGAGGGGGMLSLSHIHRRCSAEIFPSMGIYILPIMIFLHFFSFLTWFLIKVNWSKNISEPAAVGGCCHRHTSTAAAPPRFFLP